MKVQAVSVNPVDTKVRRGGDPADGMRVLGWDAAGMVEAVDLRRPCAVHLKKAHALIESGKAVGKLVLVGWPAR